MKLSCKCTFRVAAAVALWFPLQVLACDFPAGFFSRVSINPGDLFVGRDAPLGAVIRPSLPNYEWQSIHSELIWCAGINRFEVTSPMPLIYGSGLVAPGEVILQTRVPGIGVVMSASHGYPVPASGWNYTPGHGRFGWGVPHTLAMTPSSDSITLGFRTLRWDYRIIKFGPVDVGVGPQSLGGHTLVEIAHERAGKVMEIVFSGGSINTAMCGLPGAPGTQVSVPLGSWRADEFKGEGSVVDTQAFIVPVRTCQAGTEPGNENFAHLRLDPRNGSSVLDAQRGILGLNSDSDARGVGVQVLKADLTPMALTEEVQMVRMSNGDMNIAMAARYIQVGKDRPTGGVANASVGFTLTYK